MQKFKKEERLRSCEKKSRFIPMLLVLEYVDFERLLPRFNNLAFDDGPSPPTFELSAIVTGSPPPPLLVDVVDADDPPFN
ncbi:hypothetical protein DERP_012665 [Dermatophagoides pteronyssinus]|uniref:Uncharacterized protein n=1 Tax=Dermatophagoides pteronyssinus TaxID=6956 RepID=A0ABQ8IYL8_DERPT|nr:hypothetical protein DERP_012665 [Dermatophagoides pteronyssinus]